MKARIKVAVVTLVVAVPALLLGPVLFPPADVEVERTLFALLAPLGRMLGYRASYPERGG